MRSRHIVLAALVAASLPLSAALAQAPGAPAKWTPELALTVKNISNVAVSPAGQQVAFQVATAVTDGERSEWVSQIHVASSDGSRGYQLTRGEK